MAAVPSEQEIERDIAGPLAGLPARVAQAFVQRMEQAGGADPFVALVRSAASDEESATRVLKGMSDHTLAAFQTVMTAPDTPQRVDLTGACLIGITFTRYVLKTGPIAEMAPEDVVTYLTSTLQAILLIWGWFGDGKGWSSLAWVAIRAGALSGRHGRKVQSGRVRGQTDIRGLRSIWG